MYTLESCEGLLLALSNSGVDASTLNYTYFGEIGSKFPFAMRNSYNKKNPRVRDVSLFLKYVRNQAEISADTNNTFNPSSPTRINTRVHMTSTERPPSGHRQARQPRESGSSCKLCNESHPSIYCRTGTAQSRR